MLRVIVAAAIAVSLALVAMPQRAAAEIDGDCEAYISGESVREHDSGDTGSAIKVDPDSPVRVEMYDFRADRHKVRLKILGVGWTFIDEQHEINGWDRELTFNDFTNVSVGLYIVTWEGTGPDGKCEATALIRVPGSPLPTITGSVAAAAILLGFLGLGLTLKLSINAGQKWVLKVKGSVAAEREDDQDTGERRWRIRRSFSVTGALSGVLTAAGIVAFLQEAALQPPTLEFTLELLVPLTLIGVLVVPTLGSTLGSRRL